MRRITSHPDAATIGLTLGFLAVVFACYMGYWAIRSGMEARAYNRVTGEQVSTWDAMWIELRVVGDSRRE